MAFIACATTYTPGLSAADETFRPVETSFCVFDSAALVAESDCRAAMALLLVLIENTCALQSERWAAACGPPDCVVTNPVRAAQRTRAWLENFFS